MKQLLFFCAMAIWSVIASAQEANGKAVIYIYNDNGVSEKCLMQTEHMLKQELSDHYEVRTINAEGVAENKWINDAALFIVPGGADTFYAEKLNGQGNHNIKKYVAAGGAYLGICAGGYYGSSYVDFDRGGKLEVLGGRELAFFPGVCVGPLVTYDYKTNSGARAFQLSLMLPLLKEATVYYNGGGCFVAAETNGNVSFIGYYDEELKFPAIVHIKVGEGNVVLSGVHFEYDPAKLDVKDPYLKGIVPILKQHNEGRIKLIKEIFERLGVTT